MHTRFAVLAVLGVPAALGAQPMRTRLPLTPRVHVDTWTTEQGLPSQAVGNIAQDSTGFVWATLGGFVARIDDGGIKVLDASDGLPATAVRISRVAAGRADTLWLLDEQGALWAQVGTTMTRASNSAASELLADTVRTVSAPSGQRYVARREGSGTLLTDSVGRRIGVWPRVQLPPPSAVDNGATPTRMPVAVDASGWLWVADRDGYRAYLPDLSEPVAFVPATVAPSRVSAIVGRSGCLWLADVAVRRVCTVPFRTIATRVRTGDMFSRGPNGTVVVWDDTGLPIALDPDGNAAPLTPPTDPFRFARGYVTAHGDLWWSISPNADASAERAVPAGYRLLPHRAVRRLTYRPNRAASGSARDTVWYAVGDSLHRVFLPSNGPPQLLESRDAGGLVTDLQVDTAGTVWVTLRNRTLRGELLILRGDTETRVGAADGLPDAAFRVVRPDDADGAWIGTYGAGLVHYRADRMRRVTAADGLGEDVVTALLDDGVGNLWMHGNRAVHRVSWRALDDFVNQRVARVAGVAYGRRDGLRTPETSGHSGVPGAAGHLWFPTIDGAAVLDVATALVIDTAAPRVHIVGVVAEGFGAQPLQADMRLPRGARRISARFAALGVARAHDVRFAYRIDALDRDWIDAADSRQAVYSDLPPGRHQLRVRATTGAGVTSEHDALLAFVVPAYFHETPTFYALVLLATVVVFVAALRARERRLTLQAAALQQAVHDRTTHLQSALQTVETQASRLRLLDETRSRILANVSHEFRTPLSLIIGPVDDLLATPVVSTDATARQRLGVVARNAHRLRELVEQLLDAARLDAGTMPLALEVHDLVPQLRHLTESYASLAERRRIGFVLSCPVGGLRVRCDPDHIEKIVGNLVGNALKFTPEGGAVELRASRVLEHGASTVRIEVQDNGRGIAPKDHEVIFERFRQVDDSMQRAEGGTGIGLALVKELVELHGGTVQVQSALDTGSTFIVQLPAESTGVHAVPWVAPGASAAGTVSDSPEQHDALADSDVPDSERPTLLLVEDNAELREWLRDHLGTRYRVREAANGADALAMARHDPPDIIVSDVMMPIMDGLALCAAVRAEPALDVVPIVLLTARASRDSRVSGLRDGADDYVAKPVDLDELFVRLGNLVSSRRRVKARFAGAPALPAISVPLAQPPRDDEDRRLLEALTVALAEHLDDERFTADALAQALGLSRSAMYRRLQPLLGRSPIDAVWEYRLLQAAQWLTETDITVSEIAYGVGFKTVPHFSARFRERFGDTPSQYRERRVS